MSLQHDILQSADLCVKCGLCSPHCPTYTLHRIEPESPRGRIALMQALASGMLQPDRATLRYLDHCLLCRRCEKACPSGVPYAELFMASRRLLRAQAPDSLRFNLNAPPLRLQARLSYVMGLLHQRLGSG